MVDYSYHKIEGFRTSQTELVFQKSHWLLKKNRTLS
jgi:hypothetical protein